MSILATPLEPLAFDFVSFGFYPFVNNLWSWLALVTAAVSFWKIRAVGNSTTSSSSSSSSSSFFDSDESSNVSTPPLSEEKEETPASSSPAPIPAADSAVTTIRRSEDEDVVTKGVKFTVYYENDDEAEEEEEEEGDGELTVTEKVVEVEIGGDWWKSWEGMLKMKSGETSWYRYQDLTEINGNVVRLWDGCRINRPDTCISQSCVVW